MSQNTHNTSVRYIHLDDQLPKEIHRLYDEMVEQALIVVFQRDQSTAKQEVTELRARFAGASQGTLNMLLHENPVNLAADIVGATNEALMSEPLISRIKSFNATERPVFEAKADVVVASLA